MVAMLIEKDHLLALASEGMDLSHTSFPVVNSMGCVKVLTNAYSVPLKSGTQVQARVYATLIEIWHDGACVVGINAVTGDNNRCWIWSTTWTFCSVNPVHLPVRAHWNNNAKRVCGRQASMSSGKR